jgi:MoaA/NifB/PqqE/SkfB family radical SAM enzyme
MSSELPPVGVDDRKVTDFERRERLHVDIGPYCNNNCIFCMEEDRAGRKERVGAVTPEQVERILAANRERGHVTFVSGEPTLSPHFLRYVRVARRLGYETVAVISNGRRFAYAPFAEAAVRKGLNHVILSIHGGNAKLHDGLVRTPGAFDEVKEGLNNLSELRQAGATLSIHTSTVLNRRNCTMDALEELVTFLHPLVDQMVFNIMQPFGRGLSHFDRLMMRYTETADILGQFFTRHKGESLPIYLVDIPYCATEDRGVPEHSRGFVERYVRYELADAAGATPVWENAEASTGGAPLRRELVDGEMAAKLEDLEARHRDHQEQAQKARRPRCTECRYSYLCDGVWSNYIERFGWDEFEPVP